MNASPETLLQELKARLAESSLFCVFRNRLVAHRVPLPSC
jgi:hypothetical protein